MRFTKMHGAGNDYIYINTFDQHVDDTETLARAMADRHRGVGSDGLILIGPSAQATVRMEMYNADGSRGRMCGNGLRCVAKYAVTHGLLPATGVQHKDDRDPADRPLHDHLASRDLLNDASLLTIETDSGVLAAAVFATGPQAGDVCAEIGEPRLSSGDIPTTLPGDRIVDQPIDVLGQSWRITCVCVGSSHAVMFVDDTEAVPIETLGPAIENHAAFPDRINAHWVALNGRRRAAVRHWERGSGPTLACGTGACSVCVAGVLTGRCDRDLEVTMPGGTVRVHWGQDNHIYMTGPAVEVFSGDWPDA
jgi:diaminopimelate epimerase